MSMTEVGIYIRELRTLQGLTREEVAAAAGTNDTYVYRVEDSRMESPGMKLLFSIVEAVKGRGDHIMQLINDEHADELLARRLAREALTFRENTAIQGFIVTDEGARDLIESVLDLNEDPRLGERLRGFVAALRGAPQPAPKPPKTSRRRRAG